MHSRDASKSFLIQILEFQILLLRKLGPSFRRTSKDEVYLYSTLCTGQFTVFSSTPTSIPMLRSQCVYAHIKKTSHKSVLRRNIHIVVSRSFWDANLPIGRCAGETQGGNCASDSKIILMYSSRF